MCALVGLGLHSCSPLVSDRSTGLREKGALPPERLGTLGLLVRLEPDGDATYTVDFGFFSTINP